MSELSHLDIAKQAYQIWEREGRPQGRDQEHWRAAEQALLGATTAKPVGEARGAQQAISHQTGYAAPRRPSQQAAASTGNQTPHAPGAQPAAKSAQSQAGQPSGATAQRSASGRIDPAADAATRKDMASHKPRPSSRPADH